MVEKKIEPKPLEEWDVLHYVEDGEGQKCDMPAFVFAGKIRSALDWAEKQIENERKYWDSIGLQKASEIYRKAFKAVMK